MKTAYYFTLLLLFVPSIATAQILLPTEQKTHDNLIKKSTQTFWKQGQVLKGKKWVKAKKFKKAHKKKPILSKEQAYLVLNLGYIHGNANFCGFNVEGLTPLYNKFPALQNLTNVQLAYSDFLYSFASSFLQKKIQNSNFTCNQQMKQQLSQLVQQG